MSDADEIRNLLGTYCELMDDADWSAVGEMFAEAELVTDSGVVFAAGAAAVRAQYENGTRLYDGCPRTRHITANSVIDVDGDTATARSAYVVFQAVDDEPLHPIITGRYRDRFRRTENGWRFAQRMFIVDHAGDLSRHLTYEVTT